ncbi:hypothetical protein KJ660_03050 [Candidatus Micrarchaeota archaeon]|nr:hypothetical protein [Candidatus Micrarchaeota archaeon]
MPMQKGHNLTGKKAAFFGLKPPSVRPRLNPGQMIGRYVAHEAFRRGVSGARELAERFAHSPRGMVSSREARISGLERMAPETQAEKIRRWQTKAELRHGLVKSTSKGSKSRAEIPASFDPFLSGREEGRFNMIFHDHDAHISRIIPKRFEGLIKQLGAEQKEILIELITRINYSDQAEHYYYVYKQFLEYALNPRKKRALSKYTSQLRQHFMEEAYQG